MGGMRRNTRVQTQTMLKVLDPDKLSSFDEKSDLDRRFKVDTVEVLIEG